METSGELLAAKCAKCDGSVPYEPSEWFGHIWYIYRLQRAGYPFGANDLSVEEWMDMGVLADEMERMERCVTTPLTR